MVAYQHQWHLKEIMYGPNPLLASILGNYDRDGLAKLLDPSSFPNATTEEFDEAFPEINQMVTRAYEVMAEGETDSGGDVLVVIRHGTVQDWIHKFKD
jgi:hypothetical protein